MIDVLAEHNPYTVDVTHTKLTDPIRLISRLRGNLTTPTDDFLEVRVDILDPLEQVDAFWTPIIANEVDCGVVAPDHGVGVITEIPGKTQDITIERCCRLNICDMQYRCALNKLSWTGRRSAQAWAAPGLIAATRIMSPCCSPLVGAQRLVRLVSARSNRSVLSSGSPPKYRSSNCSNREPAGETLANSVADDRSFMSSGEPNTSNADRPSMPIAARAHSNSRGPRMGCRKYASASCDALDRVPPEVELDP